MKEKPRLVIPHGGHELHRTEVSAFLNGSVVYAGTSRDVTSNRDLSSKITIADDVWEGGVALSIETWRRYKRSTHPKGVNGWEEEVVGVTSGRHPSTTGLAMRLDPADSVLGLICGSDVHFGSSPGIGDLGSVRAIAENGGPSGFCLWHWPGEIGLMDRIRSINVLTQFLWRAALGSKGGG